MEPRIFSCESCMFWSQTDDEFGECRRGPPYIRQLELTLIEESVSKAGTKALPDLPQIARAAVWPVTHSTDWCGEGERLPDEFEDEEDDEEPLLPPSEWDIQQEDD